MKTIHTKPKIVFINPPTPNGRKFTRNISCASESKGEYLLMCVDFIILSGVLSKVSEITFIDGVGHNISISDIIDKIKIIEPDIIITAMIDTIFEYDLANFLAIRQISEKSKHFVLGDAFIDDKSTSTIRPYVEGIIATPFLIDPHQFIHYTKDKGEFSGLRSSNEYNKIDKSPREVSISTPLYSLFNNSYYHWPFARSARYMPVSTSWGCPFSCSYCTASSLPFHFRPANEMINDFIQITNLGIKEIYITDLSFGYPRENSRQFLELLIAHNISVSWSTYFHPSRFEPAFMDLMKKSGCHTIIIGVESKNFELLKKYGRYTNDQTIRDLISYCHKIGIQVCGDFIIGLEEESTDDILNSIKYSKELELDFASFNLLTPLPGSSIRNEAKKRGLMNDFNPGFDSLGSQNILVLGQVGVTDLIELRNKAVKDFYLRPYFLIKKIKNITSPQHFWGHFKEFFSLIYKTLRKRGFHED